MEWPKIVDGDPDASRYHERLQCVFPVLTTFLFFPFLRLLLACAFVDFFGNFSSYRLHVLGICVDNQISFHYRVKNKNKVVWLITLYMRTIGWMKHTTSNIDSNQQQNQVTRNW